MTTGVNIFGLTTAFLISFLLVVPFLHKALQVLLIYWRVPFKNVKGERMPGEPPTLSLGPFLQVNFFGRPLSKKYGPIYYIWHCFTPVVILSDARAIRTFYTDHYSHKRERDFTCLGSVFKDLLGHCLATCHGRKEVQRCREPFEKYFSAESATDSLQVIGRECAAFMNALPVGEPVDLQDRGLANVTLRVMVHVVYGKDVLNKYFDRIVEMGNMLQNAMNMTTIGATRLPFYSYLPTKINHKVRSFISTWSAFNRLLFKEYGDGRLNPGDGLFFAVMEQIKTNALEMGEEEFFHSINEILLLNIDVSFAATSFVLADLAQHQAIQHKVRQEIDKILQGSDPSTYPDLDKKLPYMEMVLKESARMHPALSLSLPEKTVKPITELGGYQIPSGVGKVIVFPLKDCWHVRFSALQLAPWSMCLTDERVKDKLQRIMSGYLAA